MTLAVDNSKFFITSQTMSTPTGSTTNSTLTATTPPEQKPDEFVNSNKKTNSNKNLLLGIGAGLAAAGSIGTVIYLIMHGKVGKATQLAEHIDFKPAQTIEEAIQFGKDNLKIKKYKGFTENDLEVLNFINEGFTNVSNKLKGTIRLPKTIKYKDLKDSTLAQVGPFSKSFELNKNIFGNMDKTIKDILKPIEESGLIKVSIPENNKMKYSFLKAFDEDSIKPLIRQIANYKCGNCKTLKEKVDLYNSLGVLLDTFNAAKKSPFRIIKQLIEIPAVKEACQKSGISTDLAKIKTLSLAEQNQIVAQIFAKTGIKASLSFNIKDNSEFHAIYHELGHLQDVQQRCFDTTDHCNFEYSKYPKELKKWVDNEADIQTANRVSEYASHGEGEFVAETFAKLMDGAKLPDDVIELYKRVKGPAIPGI